METLAITLEKALPQHFETLAITLEKALPQHFDDVIKGQDDVKKTLDDLIKKLDDLKKGLDDLKKGQDDLKKGQEDAKDKANVNISSTGPSSSILIGGDNKMITNPVDNSVTTTVQNTFNVNLQHTVNVTLSVHGDADRKELEPRLLHAIREEQTQAVSEQNRQMAEFVRSNCRGVFKEAEKGSIVLVFLAENIDFFRERFFQHKETIRRLIEEWFSELLRLTKYSNTTISIEIIEINLGFDSQERPKDNSRKGASFDSKKDDQNNDDSYGDDDSSDDDDDDNDNGAVCTTSGVSTVMDSLAADFVGEHDNDHEEISMGDKVQVMIGSHNSIRNEEEIVVPPLSKPSTFTLLSEETSAEAIDEHILHEKVVNAEASEQKQHQSPRGIYAYR